jgi:hypothetical protein
MKVKMKKNFLSCFKVLQEFMIEKQETTLLRLLCGVCVSTVLQKWLFKSLYCSVMLWFK